MTAPAVPEHDGVWAVAHAAPWLIVRFRAVQRVASWAIVGGGLRTARAVAWLGVRNQDLPRELDARTFLAERLAHADLPDAVGLLTSRDLAAYVVHGARCDEVEARCVATVGLSNALCAGDPPGAQSPIGTINVLCWCSQPLSELAALEALALAAEARTLALLEARVPSFATGRFATGTGTDCIAIASPLATTEEERAYAGKHTAEGHVIGAAVHGAIQRGVAAWLHERQGRAGVR